MTFTTDAVVLKITKTGESDRLLTLLTRDRGVIKAFAKAANRPKNKLHMSTNLFCYGSFTFYEGTSSLKVQECDLNDSFFALQNDITALSLAQYFSELMIEAAPMETEAEDFLRLYLNCIYLLANNKLPCEKIKCVFEMRLAVLSGYMPSVVGCSKCGEFESDPMYFSLETGELFCYAHKAAGTNMYPLEVITAVRHIVFSEFSAAMFSYKVTDKNQITLSKLCEKYLGGIIRKKLKTLDFYNSIK